jgi:hypothetical protein
MQNSPTKNDSENWARDFERNCRGLFKSIVLSRRSYRVTEETPDQPPDSQFSGAHFGRVYSVRIRHFTALLICCDNLHLFKSKDAITTRRHSSPFDTTFCTPIHFILSFRWCGTLETVGRISKTVSKLNIGQWSVYLKLGQCNDWSFGKHFT